MRVAYFLGLCLLMWGLAFTPAQAGWVEAKSENFLLVGDTNEKQAKKIVLELEKYRAIIFKLYNIEDQAEMMPVHIYAARSVGTVSDITGRSNVSGVYRNTREGPVFVLNIKGGFTTHSQARKIALHEYTHHIVAQYTNRMYPRWVNEGMAEYLSTFTVDKKGEVKIGLPNEGRGRTLSNYKWMDMNTLVGSVRTYPEWGKSREGQLRFYAQTWLAVHYIQSTPGWTDKLGKYLQGIPKAEDPQAFFTECFGVTPDEFEKLLRAYFKRNNYRGARVPLEPGVGVVPIQTRKLNKAEADFRRGEAVRRFRTTKKGRELAEKYYARSEEKGGPLAQIEASRAILALSAGNEALALETAERAVALSPEDARTQHVLGKVKVLQYYNKKTESNPVQIEEARKLFKNSMRANPDNLQTHFDYVMTYVLLNDAVSKQALYSAKEISIYYRSPNFIESNMRFVPLFLDNNENDYALFHLTRARDWAGQPSIRRAATQMIEAIAEK